MARVREVVLVYVEGRPVFLQPGDLVPDGVTVGVASALAPEDAPGGSQEPQASPGGGQGESDADGSDGGVTPPADAPVPPPTAGPGSSVDRWRHYAAELEVHVDRHASRADIIAAVAEAGFPVE